MTNYIDSLINSYAFNKLYRFDDKIHFKISIELEAKIYNIIKMDGYSLVYGV
jgi:hypothetical protein